MFQTDIFFCGCIFKPTDIINHLFCVSLYLVHINSLPTGYFIFFSCYFFVCTFSGTPSEYRTVWIQIRPDKMSGLIWIQTTLYLPRLSAYGTSKQRLKTIRFVSLESNVYSNIATALINLTSLCFLFALDFITRHWCWMFIVLSDRPLISIPEFVS